MSNRRWLARERLEVYLVYLILSYRYLIFIAAMLLVFFAIAAVSINSVAGSASLVPAIFLPLLASSYKFVLYTARLGAWLIILRGYDD